MILGIASISGQAVRILKFWSLEGDLRLGRGTMVRIVPRQTATSTSFVISFLRAPKKGVFILSFPASTSNYISDPR